MPPYWIEYRCLYRDAWYEYSEATSMNWIEAIARATGLVRSTGRQVRIVDQTNRIKWQAGPNPKATRNVLEGVQS